MYRWFHFLQRFCTRAIGGTGLFLYQALEVQISKSEDFFQCLIFKEVRILQRARDTAD